MQILLLALELSDFWQAIAGFGAGVVFLGGIGTAIKGIRTGIWNPFSKSILIPRRAQREQVQKMIDNYPLVFEKLERIEAEVKPNGGSSLKDTVNRIDRKVEDMGAWCRNTDETNPNAIFKLDERGNLTFANCAMCELLDADEGDLLYRDWISLIEEGSRSRILHNINEAIENKMPLESTVNFSIERKGMIRVRVKAIPHVITGGELRGFFGTMSSQ